MAISSLQTKSYGRGLTTVYNPNSQYFSLEASKILSVRLKSQYAVRVHSSREIALIVLSYCTLIFEIECLFSLGHETIYLKASVVTCFTL